MKLPIYNENVHFLKENSIFSLKNVIFYIYLTNFPMKLPIYKEGVKFFIFSHKL